MADLTPLYQVQPVLLESAAVQRLLAGVAQVATIVGIEVTGCPNAAAAQVVASAVDAAVAFRP